MRFLSVSLGRRARRAVLTLAAALVLAPFALAEGDSPKSYRFFFASDLAEKQEEFVGTGVMVVDDLCKIWETQENAGFLRFDTKYFRCAIADTETESVALLREVQKNHDEKKDSTPPLVAVFGTVSRQALFGPVKGGEDAGVASEHVVIMVDRVEKPRKRFWDEPQGVEPKQ